MTKELYHFHFRRPHFSSRFSLSIVVLSAVFTFIAFAVLQFSIEPSGRTLFVIYGVAVLPEFIIAGVLIYWMVKVRGGDVNEDEFIMYDNGWFAFWDVKLQDWIGPAKLDWVYPTGVEIKPFNIKKNRYYLVKKKKKGKYHVIFRLIWAYPNKKWENWAFYGKIEGWITDKEYKELTEMAELIEKKAKENLDSGRIKLPGKNWKQQYTDFYQQPQYWDIVFVKENLRELYRKETGEDIPEPIRSYLFDEKKFKEVYLKNKRETGDWLGKKGSETKE